MNWDEILKTPDVAGAAGALLGWLSAPGGTLKQQFFNIGAGLCCAVFVAPFIAERADIQSAAGRMAFSFVVGLVGMNILPKLMEAGKAIDWSGFLKKGGNP